MNKISILVLSASIMPFAIVCMEQQQVTKAANETSVVKLSEYEKFVLNASLEETKRRKEPNPAVFGSKTARDARRQLKDYAEVNRAGKIVELAQPTITYPEKK